LIRGMVGADIARPRRRCSIEDEVALMRAGATVVAVRRFLVEFLEARERAVEYAKAQGKRGTDAFMFHGLNRSLPRPASAVLRRGQACRTSR
jgi:hypothetical protein